MNLRINNVSSYNAYYNGIVIDPSSTNVSITNSRILNTTTGYGIAMYAGNSLVKGNVVQNVPTAKKTWAPAIYCTGNNTGITGNRVENADVGIYLGSCENVSVRGNIISNTTYDSDSYDVGIFVFHCSNSRIENNTIDDTGNAGILLMANNSNIGIYNNYIDLYNIAKVSGTLSGDENEPPTGIFVSEIYKMCLSDSSEKSTDNVSKISSYASRNISVLGNTFGENVQVLLRAQGTSNLNSDLQYYWHRKAQFPVYLLDSDEFYVRDNVSLVLQWDRYAKTQSDTKYQGFLDNHKVAYKLNKTSFQFKNANNVIAYNISIYDPKILLYNVPCVVTRASVNVSLPANMNWYRSINYSINPSAGSANVYVSAYSPSLVSWSISWNGYNQVDHMICGLLSDSFFGAYKQALIDKVIRSTPNGCINYSLNGSSVSGAYSLAYLNGTSPDLLVSPTDIRLSDQTPRKQKPLNISITARNIGSFGVDASIKCFEGISSHGTLIGSTHAYIGPHSSSNVSFIWTPSIAGNSSIFVVLDEEGLFDESDEANNAALKPVQVSGSGATTTTTIGTTSTTTTASSTTTTTTTLPGCVANGCGISCQNDCNVQYNANHCDLNGVIQCINFCPGCQTTTSTSSTATTTTSTSIRTTTTSTTTSTSIRTTTTTTTTTTHIPTTSTSTSTITTHTSTTSTNANPPTSTTTTTATSAVSTTTTTIPSIPLPPECELAGNYEPCGNVSLSEVVSLINLWANNTAALRDVITLINAWAEGSGI